MFASGKGTNFKAILDSIGKGYLRSKVTALFTDKADCGAVKIAIENNVKCIQKDRIEFPTLTRKEFSGKILTDLKETKTDFIVLSGYMNLIPDEVIQEFRFRIINIHPALLPSFGGKGMYGINVHKAVIASGAKVSGITVHFVNQYYDEGRIIFQKCCEVRSDDDEYTLQEKIKDLEHEHYSFVIKKFEEGKVEIRNGKVFIK